MDKVTNRVPQEIQARFISMIYGGLNVLIFNFEM